MFLVSYHEFGVIQKCVKVMMCMGYFLVAMEWQRLSFLFEEKKTHSSLGVWGHPLASICRLITLHIKLLLFLGRLIKLN